MTLGCKTEKDSLFGNKFGPSILSASLSLSPSLKDFAFFIVNHGFVGIVCAQTNCFIPPAPGYP